MKRHPALTTATPAQPQPTAYQAAGADAVRVAGAGAVALAIVVATVEVHDATANHGSDVRVEDIRRTMRSIAATHEATMRCHLLR